VFVLLLAVQNANTVIAKNGKEKKSLISPPCALVVASLEGACRKAELCLFENRCVWHKAVQKPNLDILE